MANTYTQLDIHCVFATKYRKALIGISWKEELHKFITAIVEIRGHKMLQINSMPDHIHMLIGLKPDQSLSSLIQVIKSESTKWINEKRYISSTFSWQKGFGAFCVCQSALYNVIKYIQNQETHHRKKSLRKEYVQLLTNAGVEYDEKFIFQDPV